MIFLDMNARRESGNPNPSTPPGDDGLDSSSFSSDSRQSVEAGGTPKRESHRFSFIENITPVMLRRSVAESVERGKMRSSLNGPLFRDPMTIGNGLSSHPQGEGLHSTVENRGRMREDPASGIQDEVLYAADPDENQSCNSDDFVNDGPFSCAENGAQPSAYRSQPKNVKDTNAPQSTINVRELASFLEKTDSFIRCLDPGKSPATSAHNEVKSMPYKARQLSDSAWNDSVSTSFSPYSPKPIKRSDV